MSGAIHAADDHLITAVATGRSGDPFAVLGRHAVTVDRRPAVMLRTMQPAASAVESITPGLVTPMPLRHPDGLFEARIPLTGAASDLPYTFRVHENGATREIASRTSTVRCCPSTICISSAKARIIARGTSSGRM